MTLDWSIDEAGVMAAADKLLALAYEFNSVPELEGEACSAVFAAVRATVGVIYGDASTFVEECVKSGITCSENAAHRYRELCESLDEERF